MAKLVLNDAVVILGGRNLSGNLNSVGLEYSADTPESTAMGDGTRTRLPGLLDVVANHSGYWESVSAADSLDADIFANLGAANSLMSLSDSGGALGDVAYSFPTQAASYTPGASLGEVFAFSLTVNGSGILVNGVVMENSAFVGTGDGTGRQVGAVGATETIYSTLHVIAVSGTNPTLDVTVESDVTDAWIGAETLRMTHPQVAVVGANRQSLVGAVTDTWWRLVMTIGGTDTPTFTVFGSLGIQQTTLP